MDGYVLGACDRLMLVVCIMQVFPRPHSRVAVGVTRELDDPPVMGSC